jgi:hypothetical protein
LEDLYIRPGRRIHPSFWKAILMVIDISSPACPAEDATTIGF